MKIFFSTFRILFFLMPLSTWALDTKQEFTPAVQSAVVYLQGAELSFVKTVNLQAGRNELVFHGLSVNLVNKSIQASFDKGNQVNLLATSSERNYLASVRQNARSKALSDSLTLIQETINQLQQELQAYEAEKNMLLQNQSLRSDTKPITTPDLKLAADFFRSRFTEINRESSRLHRKVTQLTKALQSIQQQLNELNSRENLPTSDITLLVYAATPTSTTLTLKYFVYEAGWAPAYDLRAEDVTKPIELNYRAKVFNNSGLPWNNIKLKLSTAEPMVSASKPELSVWHLDFSEYQAVNIRGARSQAYNSNQNYNNLEGSMPTSMPAAEDADRKIKSKKMEEQTQQTLAYDVIEVSQLSAEFEIKDPYSFPSDSKPYLVEVTSYKLPATYKYYSVPKLEKDAFLLARITGWADLDLVEGEADVYYGDTYVGQSTIYTRSLDDTLDLSLGRDHKVMVSREKIKDLSTTKNIASTKKETFAYEIAVRNNRKGPITITIEDQIPISKQSDISVETLELSQASLNTDTGTLTWTYNLNPGEQKKITLSYIIKYPKNRKVNTNQTRVKYKARL